MVVVVCQYQVQQLKSINNLWSDWQLGVCEFILIPVSSADEHCSQSSDVSLNNGGIQVPSVSKSRELVTRQELVAGNRLPKSSSAGQITSETKSQPASDVRQTNSVSVQDYFNKYDLSLEKIKEDVHRMEQAMKSVLSYFICLYTVAALILIMDLDTDFSVQCVACKCTACCSNLTVQLTVC